LLSLSSQFHVLLNARSGTALARATSQDDVRALLGDDGPTATVDDDMHLPMPERLDRLRRSEARVVVAAGGDGTVTAVAEAIIGTDKTLLILPLGTVNALARDLGIPSDLSQWAVALKDMEPRRIDIGEVNGQVFLHYIAIGFIPGIAAGRERIRGKSDLIAKLGFIRFFLRRLGRHRRLAVEVADPDGGIRIRRLAAIAVANNVYDEGFGRVLSRTKFDQGTLGLYVVERLGLGDLLRLAGEMLVGHWLKDQALHVETAAELTLRIRRQTVKVMFDGEVRSLDVPLRFRIRPAALSVLAPPIAAAAPQDAVAVAVLDGE
jgi:diacylglycerol kinase family enzyme